ncbi:MAG: hypothetical protein NC829_02955, partial [Candidatus Omnitrophica bacterium]|nr:hypothetical protein [Candidatus Omnitrophota bacterium]
KSILNDIFCISEAGIQKLQVQLNLNEIESPDLDFELLIMLKKIEEMKKKIKDDAEKEIK